MVDHLSQSMDYEEMLSWLLFYASLLDVTKTPAQDVIDPGGVVQSQVVQTQDGLLRLVLNASQSERTQSSRFIHDFSVPESSTSPSRRRHIRHGTRVAIERDQADADFGNYYDDLEARIDLPPERIEPMKAGNILYDREGDTDTYSSTLRISKTIFLRIVERRGIGVSAPPTRISV